MAAESQEDSVIESPDGAEWVGRGLRINKARPRDDARSSSGAGGGNGGNYWSKFVWSAR